VNRQQGRLIVSPNVPAGDLYAMADFDHPEISSLDGDVDGSVLLCNPADEEIAQMVLASLGEHFDVNEMLTAFRRRLRPAPLLTDHERERREARRRLWGNL
jgi:hypothetical protein